MPRGDDRSLYLLPFDHRAWRAGKAATREQVAARNAARYREFVDLFEER
jgi:hypothetical protein